MDKFEINKDVTSNYKGMTYHYTLNGEVIEYVFQSTPVGERVTIRSRGDYTHHRNVFMVLLEFDEMKEYTDLWWNNTNFEVIKFKELLNTVLHNDYMSEWFPKATEYIIHRELSELNDLIDYTKYWTK